MWDFYITDIHYINNNSDIKPSGWFRWRSIYLTVEIKDDTNTFKNGAVDMYKKSIDTLDIYKKWCDDRSDNCSTQSYYNYHLYIMNII